MATRSRVDDVLGEVDLRMVAQCAENSMRLFVNSYVRLNAESGGWYHDLSEAPPGPVATAVILLTFFEQNMAFAHANSCWRFLRSRQISAPGTLEDGGFALNTSLGQTVTLGGAAVLNLMGRSCNLLSQSGPNARRLLRWLTANQNEDGGWGAVWHSPSRTTITCSALEALEVSGPSSDTYRRGIDWLVATQHAEGGWGEGPGCPPTAAHTALVLVRLTSARIRRPLLLARGYEWLLPQLEVVLRSDRTDSLEVFNVSARKDEGTATWRETIHHFQLPLVLRAVLRYPEPASMPFLHAGLNRLIDSQSPAGDWPMPGPSLWAIRPSLQVFTEVQRMAFGRTGGRVIFLPGAIAVVDEAMSGLSATRVLRPPRRRLAWAKKHWGTFVAALSVVTAVLLALTSVIAWAEAAIGLVFPVLLFMAQEILARGRR